MRKYIWPRRSGKTTRLIEMVEGHDEHIIVVSDENAKKHLLYLARRMDREVNVMTVFQLLKMTEMREVNPRAKLFFDQAEQCLGQIFPRHEIVAMTIDKDGKTDVK